MKPRIRFLLSDDKFEERELVSQNLSDKEALTEFLKCAKYWAYITWRFDASNHRLHLKSMAYASPAFLERYPGALSREGHPPGVRRLIEMVRSVIREVNPAEILTITWMWDRENLLPGWRPHVLRGMIPNIQAWSATQRNSRFTGGKKLRPIIYKKENASN